MQTPVFTKDDADLKLKGFNVYPITGSVNSAHYQGRRDFYKIVLVTGRVTVGYGGQTRQLDGTFLFFGNPLVPHSVVHHAAENRGYACLFTEAFIASRERTKLVQNSPLFRIGASPIVLLNREQTALLTNLFQHMLSVHEGSYAYQDELIRSCLELLIHQALSGQPAPAEPRQADAATRITQLFRKLLERQFPIENPAQPLRLRTAQDFATSLSVHVNYLNRSVKEVTGKPTSVHIAERIVAEAEALLRHTDWSIATIAYGLGFDYPTYFNNYFKRVTGKVPNSFRTRKV